MIKNSMSILKELAIKHKLIFIIILAPFIILGIFRLSPFVNLVVTVFFIFDILLYFSGLYILLNPMIKIHKQYDLALSKLSTESTFFEINKIINTFEDLKRPFSEFKKSLRTLNSISEESGMAKTEYFSTVDVEEYFNEDTIIYKNIQIKTLNFLPQILTGLGIFGTFLGIVQGIAGLGNEMGSNEIQSAITKLLSGVEVSFRTSLYGLAFSITLTVLTKIIFDMIMSKTNILNGYINQSLIKNTQKEGFKELEKHLEKQTSSIERLATDISQELGSKIDASLDETMKKVSENISMIGLEMKKVFESSIIDNISPALERMTKVSEELGNRQEQTSDRFMQDALSRIEQVISMGTQNEMEKLKTSLEIMSEKNNEYLSKFTEGMTRIDSLFNSQKELIQGTNNSVENINFTNENIKNLQQGLGSLLIDVGSASKRNNKSIEEIEATFEKMKAYSIDQAVVIERLSTMIDKSYEYSRIQENYMDKIENSTNHINSSISNSREYIETMVDDMEDFLQSFESIRDLSMEITEKMNFNFTDIISKLERTSDILNENIQSVNNDIIGNVSTVAGEIGSISKELNVFYNNMNMLTARIENFAEVEESTQELWESYKDSFAELNENINEGILNYTEAIKKGSDEIFYEYDSKIANAVNQLKSLIETLNDTMENISDNFETLFSENSEFNLEG